MGEKELSYELSPSTRKPLVSPSSSKSDELSNTMAILQPEWIDEYEDCRMILR